MKNFNLIKRFITFVIPALLLFVGCKGPSNEEKKTVEELVKVQLAFLELYVNEYDRSYNTFAEQLDKGEITINGLEYYSYVAECEQYHPERIIEDMRHFEDVILDIKEDITKDVNKVEQTIDKYEKSNYEIPENLDEFERKYFSDERTFAITSRFLDNLKKQVVVFSEFEPIKSSGKAKMYVFTELNSGYEFKAVINKDIVEISLTDAGEEKWDRTIDSATEDFEELYSEYKDAISIKKQRNEERQDDFRRAIFGF